MRSQAAVEWIDTRGYVLPKLIVPITARPGEIKLRLLGVRNVGTRTLHDLYIKSRYNGVTKTKFQPFGLDQWAFFLDLYLGCLPPGKQFMFWIKETFTGTTGKSSDIYIEEGA